MNSQKLAWQTRKLGYCIICNNRPKRSKKANTCDQHCAGKLAWDTRRNQ